MASKTKKQPKQASTPDRRHLTADEAPAVMDAWAAWVNAPVLIRRKGVVLRYVPRWEQELTSALVSKTRQPAHAKAKVKQDRDALTALLVRALKQLGYDHPDEYFDGQTFKYKRACTRLLGAVPEEVLDYLQKHPRPGVAPAEDELSRRTLRTHTEKELTTWTRTDRDREWEEKQAADERLDPAVRQLHAEKAHIATLPPDEQQRRAEKARIEKKRQTPGNYRATLLP